MNDFQDKLKKLFPNHVSEEPEINEESSDIWMQEAPLICKYEKRNGKPTVIIEEYMGADKDFRKLTKELKTLLGVGGSYKNDKIIIQGDYRNEIMNFLKEKGFKVKRVGG